jgi:hypothetical protein
VEPAGNRPHRVAGVDEEDDLGPERGSLRGGGPASQTLEEAAGGIGQDEQGVLVVKIPESTKWSLQGKLVARQRERWPQLQEVRVRFRGNLAYVGGVLPGGEVLPLCRLRYDGSATYFGFAVYLASKEGYEDSFLPNGAVEGTPAEALDCACGLYLGDPTAWVTN